MASSMLTQKTLRVSRGYQYTYYTASAKPSKPTLLLLHGFPDRAALWFGLATKTLVPSGYGVVIPDQLGYEGTDKPTAPAEYRMSALVRDLEEILDAAGCTKVIAVGHDFGASTAQMFWNRAPQRCCGLAQVCVAYRKPSTDAFNLDGLNAAMRNVFGYGNFEYWHLNKRSDAADIYEAHLDSVFDLLYTDDFATLGREVFGEPDGMLNWMLQDKRAETLHPSTAPGDREAFKQRFQRDGFTAPLNWYKAVIQGVQDGEADPTNATVRVPYLFLGYRGDTVCRLEILAPAVQEGLLPQLTNVTLDGGHWGLVQQPDEFAKNVLSWLEKEF